MIDYEWLKSLWDTVWYACGIKNISKLLNSQERSAEPLEVSTCWKNLGIKMKSLNTTEMYSLKFMARTMGINKRGSKGTQS